VHRLTPIALTLALALSLSPGALPAQEPATTLPTIATKTATMRKLDGFLPLYWDAQSGRLWMEVPGDTEVLWVSGLAAGLGSNDIGLDRGQVQDSRIVRFHRVGPKVLLEQPNFTFRASSSGWKAKSNSSSDL
jgi:hypothetical protein